MPAALRCAKCLERHNARAKLAGSRWYWSKGKELLSKLRNKTSRRHKKKLCGMCKGSAARVSERCDYCREWYRRYQREWQHTSPARAAYFSSDKYKALDKIWKKRWIKNNQEKHKNVIRAVKCKRRAVGNIGSEDIKRIKSLNISKYGLLVCELCYRPIKNKDKDSIDHIIPICAGGTNDFVNLQITHWICNVKKGRKPESVYRAKQGVLKL